MLRVKSDNWFVKLVTLGSSKEHRRQNFSWRACGERNKAWRNRIGRLYVMLYCSFDVAACLAQLWRKIDLDLLSGFGKSPSDATETTNVLHHSTNRQ